MPQFPYQRESNPQATANPADQQSDPQEPLKFKSASEAVPLPRRSRRKSISQRESRSKKSDSSRSPFKDKSFFNDDESLQMFRENFGRPIAWTLLAAGVVFAIYYYSQPGENVAAEKNVSHSLLQEASQLESSVPSNPLEIKDHYRQQVEVADKLLAVPDDDSTQARGAELKLKSLIGWNISELVEKTDGDETTELLKLSARKFIGSANQSIAIQSRVGLMVIQTRNHLSSPEGRFWPEVLRQFESVVHVAKDDIITARSLSALAGAVESRGLENEASQLFRLIQQNCEPSDIQQVTAIGKAAKARINKNEASSLFSELKSLVSDGNVPFRVIRAKIASQFKSDSIRTSTMDAILDFAEFLIEKNSIQASKAVMEDASKGIYLVTDTFERESIKRRFDETQRRLESFGQLLSFKGLYDLEGNEVTRADMQRKRKLIVFWSPGNTDSIKLIEQISALDKEMEQQYIQVIAVCNIADEEQGSLQLKKFAKRNSSIEFLKLIRGNSNSLGFKSRFPVPKLPFLLMLEKNDRIAGLNMHPGFFEPVAR